MSDFANKDCWHLHQRCQIIVSKHLSKQEWFDGYLAISDTGGCCIALLKVALLRNMHETCLNYIVVEPHNSDCVSRSIIAHSMTHVTW